MIKKIVILMLVLITASFCMKGQNVVQRAGQANTVADSRLMANKNQYIPRYSDTTQANLTSPNNIGIDSCGAIIFTYRDNALWLRACSPKRWVKPGNISTFTFLTDSSIIICYNDGHCDTLSMYNFTTVVNNVVQNFLDSSVTLINDSTLIICNAAGSCDTIHLGNSNTYYFISPDTLVTCDTVQIICDVPDSCYQQQLCDTIVLGQPVIGTIYQNGVWKNGNIVEMGYLAPGASPSQFYHDTWLNTGGSQLSIYGVATNRPNVLIQQSQWSQLSSSIIAFNHYGAYRPNGGLLDEANSVNLYLNYTDPFVVPTQGALAGDTVGYMGSRYGYMLMTNSSGSQNGYLINDVNAKQVGVFFDTYTQNDEAVTIFGNRVPSSYAFTVNPPTDSTLLDSRLAIFKLNPTKDVQLPGYPNTRDNGVANKAIIPLDTDGNLGVGSVIASTSIVEIISDTSFRVCDLNGVCDTFIVDITNPTTINIYNDTTIIICNEAGSCDTITVNNYTITNGQVINVANTLFVSKAGNDATGQRQRLDLHFLTIRAALAAAFTGDVIVVYPGTYEENAPINLAKSVNYHFIGKGDLRLSTSVASGAIFTDSTTVCYSKIWGEHWTFTARSSQKVLYQTAASTVEMVADSITSASGSTINTAGSSNAKTKITANYMYANSFLGNLWIQGRNFYGDIDFIEAGEFGVPVWINNCASFVLHSKKIFSQNPLHAEYIIEVGSSTATDSIYIDADEIYAQLEWAVWAQGLSPNIYINAQRISANSDCVVVSSNLGMLTVKADVIEDRATGTIDGVVHGEGGNLTVINARITNASASGADVLTRNLGGQDGTVKLNSVSYDKTKVTEVTPGTIKRIDSLYYGSNFQITNGRHETDTAIIVAANNLTLGRGNVQLVSGATQITAITTAGWQAGSASVFLVFSGAPLVKNNTAGGAGTATIILAGATDFQAAANDVLELLFDGTNWREASRALAASAGGVTASEGLIAVGSDVRLGSTSAPGSALSVDRFIATAANTLTITGNTIAADPILSIISTSTAAASNSQMGLAVAMSGLNSNASQATYGVYSTNVHTTSGGASTNYGIYGYASGGTINLGVTGESEGIGVLGKTVTGTAVSGEASGGGQGVYGLTESGIGVIGQSTSGQAGFFSIYPSSTNTVALNTTLSRNTTGTAANGIGISLEFDIEADDGDTYFSNNIISKLTIAAAGSRTSSMVLNGVLSNSTVDLLTLAADGSVKLRPITATEASAITAAEGMILFVSNTNGTFTSVGFWGYQGGVWLHL